MDLFQSESIPKAMGKKARRTTPVVIVRMSEPAKLSQQSRRKRSTTRRKSRLRVAIVSVYTAECHCGRKYASVIMWGCLCGFFLGYRWSEGVVVCFDGSTEDELVLLHRLLRLGCLDGLRLGRLSLKLGLTLDVPDCQLNTRDGKLTVRYRARVRG